MRIGSPRSPFINRTSRKGRKVNIVDLPELLSSRERSGEPYLEWLRVAAMSSGVYVLSPGEEDRQRPHDEDEIYFVVEGEGRITVAEEEAPVRGGSAVFVPAGVPHRFHSIAERLTILVFFAPAESGDDV